MHNDLLPQAAPMFAAIQTINPGKLVFIAISTITITSLIAATILGWVAIGQIRRSAGRQHGMGLAVFAGLFLPLLALDLIIGIGVFALLGLLIGVFARVHGSPSTILVLLLSLPAIALLDVMVVRYVWRKVNPASGTPPLLDGSRKSAGSSISRIFALGCAGIIGLVLLLVLVFMALRFGFMPRAVTAGPQPHMMFPWASVLLGGMVLVVIAAVVGLIIFLRRRNASGTSSTLAAGCGIAALAGVVLLVLLAGSMFWFVGSKRGIVQNSVAQQQEEIANARARAEQQIAEARARAEQQMAEARARAAQQAQPAQQAKPFFRIESSRSLNQADANERRIHFMRLDNSTIMTLRRQTNAAEFQPDEFAWMRKQNVDVRPWFIITNQHIQEAGLESVDMLVARISPAYPNAWGALTPEMVLNALREEAKSWPYPTATRTLTMRDNAGQSIAWAFRTRNGDKGVLQITSFSENPNRVSIRYKLLSPIADDVVAPGSQTNSAKRLVPAPIRSGATNEISIAADGSITVAGVPCPLDELDKRLADLSNTTGTVMIKADRSLPMKRVVSVLAACNQAGITNVTGSMLEAVKSKFDQAGSFQFRWVAAEGDTNSPVDLLPDRSDRTGQAKLRVLRDVVMSSPDVDSAGLTQSQGDQKELAIFLSPRGGESFAKLTRENIGRQLAIVWQEQVLSAPVIRAEISGRRVSITGRLNDAEAQQLLDVLNKRQPAASDSTNAAAPVEFKEYVVGKTFDELARVARPSTPEEVQACAAVAIMNGDPATVLRRHTLDAMAFPPGALKLSLSDKGRIQTLQSRVLRCVVYRDELAVVIFEQAGALNSIVHGRRDGEWKIFTTAKLADTGTETGSVQAFKAKAAELLADLHNLPAQPPSLEEEQRKELATNLNVGVNSLLNTISQIVSNSGGSIHFGTPMFVGSVPQPSFTTNKTASQITADLKARLSAANSIMAFTERDAVIAAIAADAARAGDLATTRAAIQKITAFSSRDEAIVNCARQLVVLGRRNDALELAKLATAFTTRGDLIKELAK